MSYEPYSDFKLSPKTENNLEGRKVLKGDPTTYTKEKKNQLDAWALASELEDMTFALASTKDIIKAVQKADISPVVARLALTKVNELTEEVNLINKDEQVTEAYEYLDKDEQKALQKKAREVSQILGQYINNKRSPRNSKTPSRVEKKIQNVKYKAEDIDLQVTSLVPGEVYGKQTLVAYDVRRRQLIVFKAQNEDGLMIEGTTIKNLNPEATISKTVRKPEELINSLVRVTEKRFEKVYEQINSKEKSVTGRTNSDMLFLCVFN